MKHIVMFILAVLEINEIKAISKSILEEFNEKIGAKLSRQKTYYFRQQRVVLRGF